MSQILRQREIIDRRAVAAALAALAEKGEPPRAKVAALLKDALDRGRAEVKARFTLGNRGGEAARELCFLVDQIVRLLHEFVTVTVYPLANPTPGERMALVAVGGYGRGELAPYSDIDLLFLLPHKTTPHTEQVVEYMLYVLWDLGLKVGQATRSVADCLHQAKNDVTIRTALLEARYLSGDQVLFLDLKKRFESEIIKGSATQFLEAKLKERDERHARLGDSRYLVEPNVKESKGGLRDLHTLFWIAKYIYRVDDVEKLVERNVLSAEEAKRFQRAQDFLLTVRCHLHFLAERAEDRLTFDRQREVAQLMNYTDRAGSRGVERFMKHYFLIAKDIGDLTRIFCALLEDQQQKPSRFSWRSWGNRRKALEGFVVDHDRLDVASDAAFRDDPVNFLRLFQVAQEHELDIHPHALRLITQSLRLIDAKLRADPEANRLFMAMLTSKQDPETALRRLNEAGVFGRFVPDFGRVVAQMQYDMYHTYTVDEHSLMAIGILNKIETGALREELPLASEIMPTIDSRRVLYLATLLHDIAKGRGGDHSILGAEVAEKLGPRLGFTADETEATAWLVRWHLLMSNTAQKLDLDDEETIRGFVAQVQSPERLKLLLILTVADIRAVGPKIWNGWKAALLRKLFTLSLEMISGGVTATESRAARVAAAQAATRDLLKDFTDAEFDAFRAKTYPYYWQAFDPETEARHARLIREADRDGAPLTVKNRVDARRAVTELVVYTADHPGLFSRLAGALALAGANIVDAKILTMSDGMALDSFWIQDREGGAFARPDKLARLSVMFMHVLRGKLQPHIELAAPVGIPSRTRVFTVPPRVLFDNTASATHTVVEVNGRDRPGLLYDVTRAMTALNLQIARAKISTFGEKVVDVFYVKDLYGHKVTDERRLKQIREGLLIALAGPPTLEKKEAPRPVKTPEHAAE
ncbi:MAG TPA: [protein-PII] uridylyltransferase [Stellaceae bacterium]|jgi:[protein-PII] uridylyltransferase|nr:[protein-PII] uridylyltransferase [Stellaceae bacterium]